MPPGAQLHAEAVALGVGVGAVEQWPERIRTVSKADIDAAARAVLADGQSVTSLLLPKPEARAGAGQ
jgi:predicted Zn-dependent peptidase